jgi:hypothetical protein
MKTFASRLALLIATILLGTGCGSEDDAATSGDSGVSPGALSHVDGTVAIGEGGTSFVLTPVDGSAAITFTLGPEVALGEVRAIEASGSPARVSFRPADADPIAAAVVPVPTLGEGLSTYEGLVVSVDENALVIDGADGERTFDISGAEDNAFDIPHLEDHNAKDEPIRVYYEPDAPDVGIAYEDA